MTGALLYVCVMLSGRPVSAQVLAPAGPSFLQPTKPQPVVVVGWGSVQNNGQIFLSTVTDPSGIVHTDSTLQVKIQQSQPIAVTLGATPQNPLPVGITGIKAGTNWEPIRTKTEPQ